MFWWSNLFLPRLFIDSNEVVKTLVNNRQKKRPSFESIKSLGRNRFDPQNITFDPLKRNFYCIFTIEMRHRFSLMIYEVFVGVNTPKKLVNNKQNKRHVSIVKIQ